MLDRLALALLQPRLEGIAAALVRAGVHADALTVLGLALGWSAAGAISQHAYTAGLVLMAANRAADGLDGPVARHRAATDRGAFLDISADFLFYASIPLAFAFADPAANALAAALLLAAFMGTASTFLAFAILAKQRGLTSMAYPRKGFYYLGGLTEGTETMACFALMCLWPARFAAIAQGFAALCAITIVARLVAGSRLLSAPPPA